MKINVTDFGVKGDGKTLNTTAIANAISTLEKAGGGELCFPAGIYLTGTVHAVDNLTLYLESGAVLLGSPNVEDYTVDPGSERHNIYLIEARGVKNFTICGSGVIDGNGLAFWHNADGTPHTGRTDGEASPLMTQYDILRATWHRPPLVYLYDCQDVVVENVTLRESAHYTLWILKCCNVKVSGITIRNYHLGPNTDGIDVDCSQRVLIQNCDIETGDDAIALKSDCGRAKADRTAIATEDVTVSNCVLWTRCCGVRVGYEGDAPIRNCTFSNIVIRRARHGIDMLSLVPIVYEHFVTRDITHGTPIENIRFSDITMKEVGQAFFIWSGNEGNMTGYDGHIRNIDFFHITARSLDTSFIGAKIAGQICNLHFHQVRLENLNGNECADEGGIDKDGMPSVWGGAYRLGALRMLRVCGICMAEVDITSAQCKYPVISPEDVQNLTMDRCHLNHLP